MKHRAILILFLISSTILFCQGQRNLDYLLNNTDFEWLCNSSSARITIYYQDSSWASIRKEEVKERILFHIDSVLKFMEINDYIPRIHYFIVNSRKEMKKLIGWETNGTAFYKTNTIAAIGSDKIKSIYSNHELFHLIAMNLWGVPKTWINEGMAVYSSKYWRNYDLYQLTKYLANNDRLVSLNRLIKKFRRVDPMISYPLIGSFTRYLDEVYGRAMILNIWTNKNKDLRKLTGKNIQELEIDWLTKVQTVKYENIKY